MNTIPKGSKIYSNGTFICTIINDLPKGYIPQPEDFDPIQPIGTTLDNTEIKFNDIVIYRHPNFV